MSFLLKVTTNLFRWPWSISKSDLRNYGYNYSFWRCTQKILCLESYLKEQGFRSWWVYLQHSFADQWLIHGRLSLQRLYLYLWPKRTRIFAWTTPQKHIWKKYFGCERKVRQLCKQAIGRNRYLKLPSWNSIEPTV